MKSVSIITIVKNSVNLIEKTLLSAISQKEIDKEYIVIDGISMDGTVEIIKNYKDKIDIFISELDSGISDAFNKGLKLATKDFVIILNAGDVFVSDDVISKMLNCANNESIITGNCVNYKKGYKYPYFNPHKLPHLFLRAKLAHSATLIDRSLFLKYGNYSEKYKIAMDYDLFVRFFKKKEKFKYINIDVVLFDLTGISMNVYRTFTEEAKIMYRSANGFLDIAIVPLIFLYVSLYKRFQGVLNLKKTKPNIDSLYLDDK